MSSDFDRLLAELTKKGDPKVHGVLMKCVDKNGRELYHKVAGYDSVSPDAAPLRDDAVLQLGSATKLMTSIALLQCVERGLVGLDEPLAPRVLPELHRGKAILLGEREPGAADGDGEGAGEGADPGLLPFKTRPSREAITPRHLLAHTSGLGYWFTHPLLMRWRAHQQETKASSSSSSSSSRRLTERYGDYPLVFEPGGGWLYGNNLDWAGVAVSRLCGGATLEAYMVEHVWKRVLLGGDGGSGSGSGSSPRAAPRRYYPTFHVSRQGSMHAPGDGEEGGYGARLMGAAERTPDGGLRASDGLGFCAHLDDDEGGAGLSATMGDFVAVLQDLVSDAPRLLRPETISMMFEPQIAKDSPALPMLLQLRPAWDMVAGPVKADEVNHGLGGLLVEGEAPEIGQPKNMLCWGGSSNIVWFICKDQGVAGFFATQSSPFGDDVVKDLVNAWKKDFWTNYVHEQD